MKSMRRCGFEFIGSVWVRLDDCGGSKPLWKASRCLSDDIAQHPTTISILAVSTWNITHYRLHWRVALYTSQDHCFFLRKKGITWLSEQLLAWQGLCSMTPIDNSGNIKTSSILIMCHKFVLLQACMTYLLVS
jgi:hypothetical protein